MAKKHGVATSHCSRKVDGAVMPSPKNSAGESRKKRSRSSKSKYDDQADIPKDGPLRRPKLQECYEGQRSLDDMLIFFLWFFHICLEPELFGPCLCILVLNELHIFRSVTFHSYEVKASGKGTHTNALHLKQKHRSQKLLVCKQMQSMQHSQGVIDVQWLLVCKRRCHR